MNIKTAKDEILIGAKSESLLLLVIALLGVVMTAFYMSRLVFMTFFGEKRWGTAATEEEAHESETEKHEIAPHESPMVMWLPLVLLSGLAAIAGLLNLPFSHDTKHLEKWLEPILFGNEVHVTASGQTKWLLAVIAIIGASVGGIEAIIVY